MIFLNSIVTQNRLQFWDYLAKEGSFQKYLSPHLLAARSSSLEDPFFNYVFSYDKSCFDTSDQIIRFFRQARFHWWIQPHQTSFAQHLMHKGLKLNIRVQGMQALLHQKPEHTPCPPIQVQRINTWTERTIWTHVAAQGLSTRQTTFDQLCPAPDQKNIFLYLGHCYDQPASTCLAFYGTTSVGIYWLATLPQFRKQGMARAMLHQVFQDAYAHGYQSITLQSSPSAVSIYESLGFQSVEQYNLYLWQGEKTERHYLSKKNF